MNKEFNDLVVAGIIDRGGEPVVVLARKDAARAFNSKSSVLREGMCFNEATINDRIKGLEEANNPTKEGLLNVLRKGKEALKRHQAA